MQASRSLPPGGESRQDRGEARGRAGGGAPFPKSVKVPPLGLLTLPPRFTNLNPTRTTTARPTPWLRRCLERLFSALHCWLPAWQSHPALSPRPPIRSLRRASRPGFSPSCRPNAWLATAPQNQEKELDLGSRQSLLRGGASGPSVVPGSAERSLLFQKVETGEMPLGQDPLSPGSWTASGAGSTRAPWPTARIPGSSRPETI